MEKYYLVEQLKQRFMIDAFNTHVIKQKNGKLEMLSSKAIKPNHIGIRLKEGVISCNDDKYEIEEIDEEKAKETLAKINLNYSQWQDYMSTSKEKGSSHLSGPGGAQLA